MLFQHMLSVYKVNEYVKGIPFIGLVDTTGTEVAWFAEWIKEQDISGLVVIPFQVFEETEEGNQQKKWIAAIPPDDKAWHMVRRRIREWEEDLIPLFTKKEQRTWKETYGVDWCATGGVRYDGETCWKRKNENAEIEEMWGNFMPEDLRFRAHLLSEDKKGWLQRQKEKQELYPSFYKWLGSLATKMKYWQVSQPNECMVRTEGFAEKK